MQKRNRPAEKKAERILFPAIAGAVGGGAVGFLLFSLLAAVMCKIDVPAHMLTLLSTVAASLAVIPAGFIFAILYGEKGMLYGMLMGVFFFLVLLLAALLQGQTAFTALSAIKGFAMPVSGAIGGAFGISARDRRRRIH